MTAIVALTVYMAGMVSMAWVAVEHWGSGGGWLLLIMVTMVGLKVKS